MRLRALLLLLLALARPVSALQGDAGDLSAVRAAFESGASVFGSYDAGDPANVEATRAALVEVFRAGTLDQVHALLNDGTIDAEMSQRLAAVRNDMIEEVRRDLAKVHRDVHVTNFSPATNLLNDIDQTFRPSKELEEVGIEQSGTTLKDDFRQLWFDKFQIQPDRMDVVSHTSEAGIPDWRKSREVHSFVGQLRKGSRMLSDNPEAYYLEGAFRLQVERRSFASELELYSIYSYSPRTEDGTTKVALTVARRDGTIGDLAYEGVAPEIRRSYATGSTVGNWWFMNAHGGGTRYAAKYGLRSFSEGPGFLVTWDDARPGAIPQPVEFEKLGSYAARQSYCDDVYNTHFRSSELTRAQLWDTLETARVIRNAGDRFTPELAFEKRALEMVAGDRDAYERDRSELLAQADREFRESMTKVMIRNIEVALPERLADWLDPNVDPRVLGLSEDDIRDRTPVYDEEMSKARKRLRTAALFESMHALRVLEPEVRERVLESAIEALKRRSGADERGRYPFERSLRAVAKLAGGEARPRLLQLDDERLRKQRYTIDNGLVVVIEDAIDPRLLETPPLAEQVDALRTDFDAALKADGLARTAGGALLDDLAWRWSRGIAEAEDSLRGRIDLFDPRNYRESKATFRRMLWNQLGWRAEADWKGISSLGPDADPTTGMTFSREQLYDNVADWGNAQTVLSLIDAYRKGGSTPDARYEAVTNTLLFEMATRLPYVGDAFEVSDILAGRSNPYVGTGLMVGTFLYPGVGQVVAIYGVASGTWQLVYELSIEEWTRAVYQGTIPNLDGSPGPGRSTSPVWKDTVGVLEVVRDWMMEHRAELERARENAPPAERAEFDRLLATRFPAEPNIAHVRDAVYPFYSRRLHEAFESSGVPPATWNELELQTFGAPIRSNDPSDLVLVADLPPLLRAYVRPIVRAYFEGTGDFAGMPAHAAAHAHPFHRDTYFHTNASTRSQAIEDLTSLLSAAYMRALIARARGMDTGLVIDPAWNAGALTSAEAYLFGLPAANFVGRERTYPGAGPIPALPALLDLFGATRDAQVAGFFPALDAELNRKLERYAAKHGTPARDDFDAFKLGKHHATLRPVAAENQAVAHPLLLAFFNRVVHQHRAEQRGGATSALDDPMAGEFELPEPDTGSVGASETTAGAADVWRATTMDAELAEADLALIQAGVVQALIADYKRGLLQAIAHGKQANARRAHDAQLPASNALGLLGTAIWDHDSAGERALSHELAKHEWVPTLIPDEEFARTLEGELRRISNDVEIEIEGVPSSPVGLGGSIDLQCAVSASDLFFERPYRVSWELTGLDAGATEEADGASPAQREHRVAFEVGNEEDGIEPRSVQATAHVTDATGRTMGSATTTFALDPLEVADEEEDEPVVAAPGASTPPANDEEEEELEVEVAYYVIRVEGAGWVPHYAGGSYITSGYNDETLAVKNGDDPQAAIDAYRARLDTPPCEVEVPAIPGLHKRPALWTSGPFVHGVEGPYYSLRDVYGREYENTWTFAKGDGPSLGKIREMFGCN